MAPPMPPPPVPVHSVRDFCYYQSQFMRDQYLDNPELLEYTVRAVLGPAVTAGWTRSDIQEQFYQALQPPPPLITTAAAAAAVAAAAPGSSSTRNVVLGGNRAEGRKSANDNNNNNNNDDNNAADTLRVGATSPTRRTALPSGPDSATTENAVSDTPAPQLKTPSPTRLPKQHGEDDDHNAVAAPALGSFQNHHDIDGSALKRDSQGRFKRPKGRPPKGYRWDDSNGRWIDDGTSKAAPRSIKLQKNWKQPPISALAATRTTTTTPSFMRRDGARDGAHIWSGVYDVQVEPSPPRTTQEQHNNDHRQYLPVETTTTPTPSLTDRDDDPSSPPPPAPAAAASNPKKDTHGRYKQPKGRPPKNCYWDVTSGHWRPHHHPPSP